MLPLEWLKALMRVMRVVAFDWRVTVINSILLASGVIIHVVIFVNNYSMTSMDFTDLRFVSIASQIKTYDDIVSMVYGFSDSVNQSMMLRSSLVSMNIEMQANMTNSNGVMIDSIESLNKCSNADCQLYDADLDKLLSMKHFMKPLERSVSHPIFASVSIRGSIMNRTTIDSLRATGWLPSKLSDGLVLISLVFRTSLTDTTDHQVYFIAFDIGKSGRIFYKNVTGFRFNIDTNQEALSIAVMTTLGITALLYIIKYIAKSNFLFSQYFLFYGAIYTATVIFTLAASGQHRALVIKINKSQIIGIKQISDLYYTVGMAKLSLFLIFVVMAIEVIKVFVYAKRFKRMRSTATVIMRSMAILIKTTAFIVLLVLVSTFALVTTDNLSVHSYIDLVFGHAYISISETGYRSSVIASMIRLLDTMITMAMISIIFVCISNAECLDYEGDDLVTNNIVSHVSTLTTKSLKLITETTKYIETINKKKVRYRDHRKNRLGIRGILKEW